MAKEHESVLPAELVKALDINNAHSKGIFIDATVGAGGHTLEILKNGGEVIGLDADSSMLDIAERNLKEETTQWKACPAFKLIHANFNSMSHVAEEQDIKQVNGIIFDLGISNVHFADNRRGFSFEREDALLDMRLDKKHQEVTAADLVNNLTQKELVKLFCSSMEISEARYIANQIIKKREDKKLSTVGDLLKALTRLRKSGRIHPATKAFQALRIAVNYELDSLVEALPQAFDLLAKKGRLAVISFHSGEDRIVKNYFAELVEKGVARNVAKKPITASREELERNKKARSAKLRVLEKI